MLEIEKGNEDDLRGRVFIYGRVIQTSDGSRHHLVNVTSSDVNSVEDLLQEGSIDEDIRRDIINSSRQSDNSVYGINFLIKKQPNIGRINGDIYRIKQGFLVNPNIIKNVGRIFQTAGFLYLTTYEMQNQELTFSDGMPEEEMLGEMDAVAEFNFYSEMVYKTMMKGKSELLRDVLKDFERTFKDTSYKTQVGRFIDSIKMKGVYKYEEISDNYEYLLTCLEEEWYEDAGEISDKIKKLSGK